MSDEIPEFESMGELPTAAHGDAEEILEEQKSVEFKPGDRIADRFEVQGKLGFGGMGAVYKVKDTTMNEERALKVMLPSLLKSEKAKSRFLEEIKISQQLSHDSIVRVHDLMEDTSRGLRFFTMELVQGVTLADKLKASGGKLPVEDAVNIMEQLYEGLEYAHKYTIHRDLKPQNIMIQPDGKVKILDFGLAKLMTTSQLNQSSHAMGTAYYQAPEQGVHLKELDQRADIYSLGVIFYQMLTGKIPVGAVALPSKLNSKIPKKLDSFVMKCLSPEMEDRYVTVGKLALAMTGITGGGFSLFTVTPTAVVTLIVLLSAIGAGGYWLVKQKIAAFFDKVPTKEEIAEKLPDLPDSAMLKDKFDDLLKSDDPVSIEAQENRIEAIAYYMGTAQRIDEDQAKRLFQKAADAGDPLAKMWVARWYWRGGCGYEEDKNRSKELTLEVIAEIETLANSGDPEAEFLLASALSVGQGTKKDSVEAMRLYESAAGKGNAFAMNNIGNMYYYGEDADGGFTGIEADIDVALDWFTKAANAGDVGAMHNLGYLIGYYEDGPGNLVAAKKWYEKAAEKQYPDAEFQLGDMYQFGDGTPIDKSAARSWFEKAQAHGHEDAAEALKQLAN